MPIIVIPYKPRQLQKKLHDEAKRFNVWVTHRRFGKTVCCLNHIIRHAVNNKNDRPQYAYIHPTRSEAKKIAWDYIKKYTEVLPGMEYNEAELLAEIKGINGAKIYLFGCDRNPDAGRGMYFDGAILDESQLISADYMKTILPTLIDRKGWLILTGTPAGHTLLWDSLEHAKSDPDWSWAIHRASETGIIPQEELELLRRNMDDAEYQQEFECDFSAAIKGSYYGNLITAAEREGRITTVPLDPTLPVHTAWDIGRRDATAIWFIQERGPQLRAINYYQQSGQTITHFIKYMQDYSNRTGCIWGTHYGPHDLQVTDWGSNESKSRFQIAQDLGIRFTIVPRRADDDSRTNVRGLIPRMWFDADNCKLGLDALRLYRRSIGEMGEGQEVKDWTNHGADALKYFANGFEAKIPTEVEPHFRNLTFNEAFNKLKSINNPSGPGFV